MYTKLVNTFSQLEQEINLVRNDIKLKLIITAPKKLSTS